MHDHLRTVIVAPMITKSRPAPFRISVAHGGQKGLILLDQVRAVDKARLAKKAGGGVSKGAHVHFEHAARSLRRVKFNSVDGVGRLLARFAR